jgi:hypothetical protein
MDNSAEYFFFEKTRVLFDQWTRRDGPLGVFEGYGEFDDPQEDTPDGDAQLK